LRQLILISFRPKLPSYLTLPFPAHFYLFLPSQKSFDEHFLQNDSGSAGFN